MYIFRKEIDFDSRIVAHMLALFVAAYYPQNWNLDFHIKYP